MQGQTGYMYNADRQYSPYGYAAATPGMYPVIGAPPPQTTFVAVNPATEDDSNRGRRSTSWYEKDSDEETRNRFSDKSIRRGFIRKVYSILSLQLLVTLAVIAVCVFVESVKNFIERNRWIFLASMLLFLTVYLTLVCCENCRRQTPGNYICLSILTLAMSCFAGAASSKYAENIVLLAVGITALVTISLTLFAMQTKIDLTLCSGMLCVLVGIVIAFGFLIMVGSFLFPGYIRILHMVYAAVSALMFCLFLVYDTQMLIGGRRYSLSEEEYICAALQLYVDIIYLFLDILSLLGHLQSFSK